MNESNPTKVAQTSSSPDQLLMIGQILWQTNHWKPAMDKIVPILRSIIIFDNLVLYLPDGRTDQVEAVYARVVGRGRSVGPDINWGEAIANQVYKRGRLAMQHPTPHSEISERLDLPYLLAIPLISESQTLGSLVFIRFGGPEYTSDNTRVAIFLAEGLAQILLINNLKHKLTELELVQQQVRLQEDFISTISHELLTPLGFIKGYATTLLRSDATWDEANQKEFLNIIDQETDRLQELIDNLLDSARLQSGTMRMQFQPVRLDILVKDVVTRARQHHEDIQIHTDLPSPARSIQGDPRRLAQVFENLLSNAIKYAPGSPIEIILIEGKDHADLAFKDAGPGIRPEVIPHLFERFFRNPEHEPNVRGTGLGLFICRQIVEAHQGSISIQSNLGEGTTVHISLPYEQSDSGYPSTSTQIKE
ncbi:MAG: GAF domain-containing sensor histidine kinase [Chloroflexi bacterium]|nr:GAF domain-containing sensor histidine kinase [Chloroflexota bacterium]